MTLMEAKQFFQTQLIEYQDKSLISEEDKAKIRTGKGNEVKENFFFASFYKFKGVPGVEGFKRAQALYEAIETAESVEELILDTEAYQEQGSLLPPIIRHCALIVYGYTKTHLQLAAKQIHPLDSITYAEPSDENDEQLLEQSELILYTDLIKTLKSSNPNKLYQL